MRFLLSVIGLAAVLWWTFVWRFDGKTPAQYATIAWHSPLVQHKVQDVKRDLPPAVRALWPDMAPSQTADAPKTHDKKHPAAETYSEKDRRSLDDLLGRMQKDGDAKNTGRDRAND